MKSVVAIIHTYAQDGDLGSYLNELVAAFANFRVKLHLIITNDLVSSLNARGLSPEISERKYIDYIKSVEPEFVFTTNRGGVTHNLMREIDCPILTWMVDRIPFLHHGGGHDDLFCEKDHVITSSYKNVERLETIYPVLKGRVHFIPFATNPTHFERRYEKDIAISFVGTYFYAQQLTAILGDYQDAPNKIRSILDLMAEIEADYDLDFPQRLDHHGLRHLLKEYDIDIYKFKGLLANNISLNWRVRHLDAVADCGLKLYGTRNWINVNPYSSRLLRCYQQGVFVKTREQLVEIYQRSKIALNVPHVQAVDGLPYRVYDILATDALLINNHRENSDLYRLFGHDMPVPLYRDEADLRKMVRHYLNHDDERDSLVRACNELVVNGFSFEDRVRSFFDIVGSRVDEGRGDLVRVARSNFAEPGDVLRGLPIGGAVSAQGLLPKAVLKSKIALKRVLPRKIIRLIHCLKSQ